MTDLLTRIRAYVAEIPTHECKFCGAPVPCQKQTWGRFCPIEPRQDTPADALLREVAALEPVAFMHSLSVESPMMARDAFLWSKAGPFEIPLYALTGDSHDPD